MDLTRENLLYVLGRSGSMDNRDEQSQAEAQLKDWEVQGRYHHLLQTVYLDGSIALQSRWLAIICFKNGVEKYWRDSRKNSIPKNEKTEIRKRMFDLLGEHNNQLMIQNAHSLARMSRYDFPAEWPTLFEDFEKLLKESFEADDSVRLNNLLLILNQVIKMLASVKIGRIGPALLTKLPGLIPILIVLYSHFFDSWTSNFDLTAMELGYLCLKILKKAILIGYEYPYRNENVVEFFHTSLAHFQKLIIAYNDNQIQLLSKYLKCFNKLYLSLIEKNASFFMLMPSGLEILKMHLIILEDKAEMIYKAEDDDFWQVLAIQIFKILKELLKFLRSNKEGPLKLKNPSDKDDIHRSTLLIQDEVFSEAVVNKLALLIMTWFLRLSPQDLESWNLEPEEWVNEQNASSWEYQLRPCCENFFQDLTYTFPPVAQLVLDELSKQLGTAQDILTKDSLLAAFEFSEAPADAESVQRQKMFLEMFIPEALKNEPIENMILKRRVLLVIGDRISFNNFKDGLLATFKLFIEVLGSSSPANDIVVKLTALQVMKKLAESFVFDKATFKPFLNDFLQKTIKILSSVELSETEAFILDLLSIIITQSTPLVPTATLIELLGMVPGAWDSSNDSSDIVLKQTLIRLLTTLVTSLADESVHSYAITIPLLQVCCNEKSEAFSILSEDGFDLWNALIVNYPLSEGGELPSAFVQKLPMLVEGLLNSTEILATIMKIARGYALIDPKVFFMTEFGTRFADICGGYLGTFRDDIYLIFISILEILALKGGDIPKTDFFKEKFLSYIVNDEISAVPDSNKGIAIISRLAWCNPQQFTNGFFPSEEFMTSFIQLWINRIPTNSARRDQKVFVLGLLAIFRQVIVPENTSIPETYLSLFHQFIQAITQLLEEINEDSKGDCEMYQLSYYYDEYNYTFDETILGTGEFKRVSHLYENLDPVHNVNLKNELQSWLNGLQQSVISHCLDPSTFEQLQMIMSRK